MGAREGWLKEQLRTTDESKLDIYGIIGSDDAVRAEARARRVRSDVRAISAGPLAALVGARSSGADVRRTLIDHFELLSEVATEVDVLPIRHGVSVSNEAALRGEVLGRQRSRWTSVMDGLSGMLEVRVRIAFKREPILARIVESDPEIHRLQDEAGREPPDLPSPARVSLGRLVVDRLEARRKRMRRWLRGRIPDYAVDVREAPPATEMGVATLSFLTRRGDVEPLKRDLEMLPEAAPEPITVRVIGPLPPWSFVEGPRRKSPAASRGL
jgi:hypothetical protein